MTTPAVSTALIATQTWLVTWAALATSGDIGLPWELWDAADNCCSLDGTFGTGGSVTFQGSNDGTNYYTLHDPQGNALTFTAAGMKQILETPRYIRPNLTAGTGTISLIALIKARRGSR